MGNFFSDIGKGIESAIKDPTSLHPFGFIANVALGATDNRTIGEGVLHTAGFDNDSGDELDTSGIADKAANLVENTPQASLDSVIAEARAMAELNLELAPEISQKAAETSLARSAELDTFMEDRFFRNLENVLPGFKDEIVRETLESRDRLKDISATAESRLGSIFNDVSGIASEFLSGELPQDVQDFIASSRAELNLGHGLFGDVASSATARDLGMTSLDLVGKGIDVSNLASTMASNEATLLANLESGISDQTRLLLAETQALTPPVTDVPALFSQEAARFAGASLISPTSVLQTGADISKFNATTSFDAMLSQLNVDMDLFSTDIQNKQNNEALKVQKQGQFFDLVGTGIGAAFGAV